ncbi:hypothetical protein [Ruegeria sp.]|uniref:hypothetical protein n=1 Tax=Ruegeria sp. TaxID=1879320 RepID=UPI00231B8E46|nr:hypothetical protein [Ruegeria sp.]MDA7964109.1 hypothetical protein [Ruegeria sp.]
MYNEYDKSLHAPWGYRTMESPPQELDDDATDVAIAGLLKEEAPDVPSQAQVVFPTLAAPSEEDKPQETGVAAILRQTWAHLSGAA